MKYYQEEDQISALSIKEGHFWGLWGGVWEGGVSSSINFGKTGIFKWTLKNFFIIYMLSIRYKLYILDLNLTNGVQHFY